MKVNDGILFTIFVYFGLLKLYRQIYPQPQPFASESFEALDVSFCMKIIKKTEDCSQIQMDNFITQHCKLKSVIFTKKYCFFFSKQIVFKKNSFFPVKNMNFEFFTARIFIFCWVKCFKRKMTGKLKLLNQLVVKKIEFLNSLSKFTFLYFWPCFWGQILHFLIALFNLSLWMEEKKFPFTL